MKLINADDDNPTSPAHGGDMMLSKFSLTVLLAAGLLIGAGCSSSSSGDSAETQTGVVTEKPAFVPSSAVAAEPIDGVPVWVDEEERVVYTTDCDLARRITESGAKYGPGERDPETLEFTPGYAFICPS